MVTISFPVFWEVFKIQFNTQDHWQLLWFSLLSKRITACFSFNVPASKCGKQCGLKTKERGPRDDIWSCPAVFLTLCLGCWSCSRGRSSFQPYLEGKKATGNKHIWGTFLSMNLERTSYLFFQGRLETSQLQAAAGVGCVPARSLKEKLSLETLSKLEDLFCIWCVDPCTTFSELGHHNIGQMMSERLAQEIMCWRNGHALRLQKWVMPFVKKKISLWGQLWSISIFVNMLGKCCGCHL